MLHWRCVGWVRGEAEWLRLCIPSSCGRWLDRMELKSEAKVRFLLSPSSETRVQKLYVYITDTQVE
jgi:hypothetical protein